MMRLAMSLAGRMWKKRIQHVVQHGAIPVSAAKRSVMVLCFSSSLLKPLLVVMFLLVVILSMPEVQWVAFFTAAFRISDITIKYYTIIILILILIVVQCVNYLMSCLFEYIRASASMVHFSGCSLGSVGIESNRTNE
jgi:hypothetical protein